MKTILTKSLAALLIAMPLAAAEPGSFLGVKANVEGKASYKDIKGSSTRIKIQTRTLNVEISNFGKEDIPGVKVKWWIFGHTMKDHKLVKLGQGERVVLAPARDGFKFASSKVEATGTRKHKVSSRKRPGKKSRGKKSRTTIKSVPASGKEYYGYAVEIYVGGKLVASIYSQPSFEKELHSKKQT